MFPIKQIPDLHEFFNQLSILVGCFDVESNMWQKTFFSWKHVMNSLCFTKPLYWKYNPYLNFFSGEREHVQKKTFTKWVNSHLARINCRITDLYTDLRDGKYLIKLLEILSGERLPRPTKGKMRIHCLENVDKALSFLYEQRVQLENMGAHDIVDGHARLTLGLIWTIILRFQIQDITTVRILI